MPASSLAARMPSASRIAGAAVDWKPCASPWMMFVAWPVSDARAGVRAGRERREDAGHDQPLVERALDVALAAANGVGADDRGDQRHAADHERIHRHGAN